VVHVLLVFLSELREFPSRRALQEKKVTTARVAILLNRASPEILLSNLCNPEEICNSVHKQSFLSNDTIEFVLRKR